MKDRFGLLKARPLGSYLAFTLGAFPTIWYFLPDHPSASQLGVWGFILAFFGMIIGSLLQNILQPKKIKESA